MRIVVNGAPRVLDKERSVADLLAALGLEAETVVVERNGEIVTSARFCETGLVENDRLEVLRFVGGG